MTPLFGKPFRCFKTFMHLLSVSVYTHHSAHVEARGQLMGTRSLLPSLASRVELRPLGLVASTLTH